METLNLILLAISYALILLLFFRKKKVSRKIEVLLKELIKSEERISSTHKYTEALELLFKECKLGRESALNSWKQIFGFDYQGRKYG